MAKYKLTYFGGKGRGEVTRLIFAQAGVPYEDIRIQWEDWAELKPKTPSGTLPILETEGVTLCQSNAIARYLARKFELAGKTAIEEAQCDIIVDHIMDALDIVNYIFGEKDEKKKAEHVKKFIDVKYPAAMAILEKVLTENNGGDGFLVGNEVTWADITFIHSVSWPVWCGATGILDSFPKLKALKERVENLPNIKAWIAKRPVTSF